MKVFIACLGTESNTFSPFPTGRETYAETMLFHGDATKQEGFIFSEPMRTWRRLAEAAGAEVVESIGAFTQPAGPTVQALYEEFRAELLGDLEAAMPVDMVLISMHGAMVADDCDDCEGDILARARAIVGSQAALGCELDLHCSITPEMVQNADAIVTFKEYPHIDFNERAEDLYQVLLGKAQGRTKPVIGTWDMRMISTWRTLVEPVRSFVDKLQSLEGKDGILSISFGHGFPWGDVEHVTATMLVISDGDQAKAEKLAEELGREVFAMRDQTHPRLSSMAEAFDAAVAANHFPVVLADVADNAGGGAPSDSTFVLREVLDRGLDNVATGLYWDPVTVRFCKEGGVGATLDLRIAGKCGAMSGDPLDLSVTVMGIIEGASQTFGDATAQMGDAVWLRCEPEIDLIVTSVRTQTFHPNAFTQFGLDLSAKKIVVVKSSQHFYAGFEPVAAEIHYIGGEGALNTDFANIPYTKLKTPYWPKVEDPYSV
ncbi:MAG: microcystin LR degradation protein MlrC-like protein [Rhodospirillaceae bacterium]|nr:microcystin LR degradation protein MlrC-like protein [Rhodospirillaceae bacterium]